MRRTWHILSDAGLFKSDEIGLQSIVDTIKRCTHHEFDGGIRVVNHEVVVGFVVHAVRVSHDLVPSEPDSRAHVVLDGVVAENVAVASCVKAWQRASGVRSRVHL